jgi:predicted GIY-YIG superfamily endonuclease
MRSFNCLAKRRDTYNYNLWDGSTKVYEGITNDPEVRGQQHKQDKKFTRVEVRKPAVSRETALKREQGAIERYRQAHSGRPPKYNK